MRGLPQLPGLRSGGQQRPKEAVLQAACLALILLAAAGLRLHGLDWDGGHWLHPDERQVYFVVNGLGWPDSLAETLRPDSPFNPGFFAYGSLSFYLLRAAAALLALLWPAVRDPDNLHLAGRTLAALLDVGTVYLTYRLVRALPGRDQGRWPALLAAALLGLAVLPVQQAHFYTADVLLTFLVLLTLNLAADLVREGGWAHRLALGITLGLSLATKLSAAPLVLVAWGALAVRPGEDDPSHDGSRTAQALPSTMGTLALAALVFFLVQPYALVDTRTFVAHTLRESQIARGAIRPPYTLQYAGTLPYLYSMWQTAFWGLGLPLGALGWTGLAAGFVRWLRHGSRADALLLAWAGAYFVAAGLLYTRYLRYMLPLLPILCVLAARFLWHVRGKWGWAMRWGVGGLALLSTLGYALSFARLYAEPHPWIVASEWIYRQVPAGSTVAVEAWDTPLPLPLVVDGQSRYIEAYDVRTLTLYAQPDDFVKWQDLVEDLAASDILVIASRRGYGAIPRRPDRYPVATRYYELLFDGQLGFELVGEFSRGPEWLNPRLPPLPDAAPAALHPDESFVVYDHPRALVFRNSERLSGPNLMQRLKVPGP